MSTPASISYEDMPYAELELLGRALARVERHDGGALTVARVTREDFGSVDPIGHRGRRDCD